MNVAAPVQLRAPESKLAHGAAAILALLLIAGGAAAILLPSVPDLFRRLCHAIGNFVIAGSGGHPADPRALIGYRLRRAGWFLEACGFTALAFRSQIAGFMETCGAEFRSACRALRRDGARSRFSRTELAAAAAIFGIGVFARLWHLRRGIRYDEACTFLLFVEHPSYVGLSFYPLTNNHLLHTMAAHFSTMAFGHNTAALRLPAFTAGCLTVAATWAAARSLYGSVAGLIAAAFTAALPPFIEYSVNARGYSFLWLSVVVMMHAAGRLARDRDSRCAWLEFAAAAVLGVFTLPTALLPLSALGLWVLVATREPRFMTRATVAIAGACAILYLPLLIVSGPMSLVRDPAMLPIREHYFRFLGEMARASWIRWTEGVPGPALALLVAGVVAALAMAWRHGSAGVSMALCMWAGAFAAAWARHITGRPRIWTYLLLAAAMLAGAGIAALISLAVRNRARRMLAGAVLSVAVAGTITAGVIRTGTVFHDNETGAIEDTQPVIRFLSDHMTPADRLIATRVPARTILLYEFERRYPALYSALQRNDEPARVFAVVSNRLVLSEALSNRERMTRLAAAGPADPDTIRSEMDLSGYGAPKLLAQYLTVSIYRFEKR